MDFETEETNNYWIRFSDCNNGLGYNVTQLSLFFNEGTATNGAVYVSQIGVFGANDSMEQLSSIEFAESEQTVDFTITSTIVITIPTIYFEPSSYTPTPTYRFSYEDISDSSFPIERDTTVYTSFIDDLYLELNSFGFYPGVYQIEITAKVETDNTI